MLEIKKNTGVRDKQFRVLSLMEFCRVGSILLAGNEIKGGANVNGNDDDGDTPLHCAVTSDKNTLNITAFLLRKGADVNAKNKKGVTPLHSASARGDAKLMKLLIEKGADVNVKDNEGCTPIFWAIYRKNEANIAQLLEQGASSDVKNEKGESPDEWVPPGVRK